MSESIVSIRNLATHYPITGGWFGPTPVVRALDNIDLEIKRGQFFGLVGESGSGKTTLLRLIAGLEAPSAGEVIVQGTVASTPDKQVAPDQRAVGMVVQEYALFPHMTVEQNIAFGLHGLDSDERVARVAEVMELVQLPELGSRYPHELSGGQKQRFSIATTLVNDPLLLFLDEPTTGLDPQARRHLWELVKRFKTEGRTVLMTTHYMEEAGELCDRVAIMDRGRIVAMDPPDSLIDNLLAKGFQKERVEKQANLEDVFLDLTGRALRDE